MMLTIFLTCTLISPKRSCKQSLSSPFEPIFSHINLQRGINEAYAPQRAYLASSLQYPWNPSWVWSRCEGRVYHFPLKVCHDGCRGLCNSAKLSSIFPSMTLSLQREKEICTLDKSKLVQRTDHRYLYFAFYLHGFFCNEISKFSSNY